MTTVIEVVRALHNRLLVLERAAVKRAGDWRLGAVLRSDMGDIMVGKAGTELISKSSDDGYVVKIKNADPARDYVIKVYKQPIKTSAAVPVDKDPRDFDVKVHATGRAEEYVVTVKKLPVAASVSLDDKYVAVARDQVLREFKALTLLKGHPNVPGLLSSEVDTCTLHVKSDEILKSFLIKMEYLPNLKDFYSTDLKNFEKILGDDGSVTIDFVHMHILVDYVYGQAASLVTTLNEKGIQHRDIDVNNFLIQPDTLRIILMDFARAKLPYVDGMPDSQDPDVIAKHCEDVMSNVSSTEEELEFAKYKHRRYKNYNKEATFGDMEKRDVVSDSIMFWYFISKAMDHLCTECRSRFYDSQVEVAILKLKILKLKDLFDTDVKSIVHLATPPTENLKLYYKVHTSGKTQVGKQKLILNKPINIVYSPTYEDTAKKIKNGTLGSVEIKWD
jgi:serine/threonine protein kinase